MKGTLDVVSFSACMRQPDKHDRFDLKFVESVALGVIKNGSKP